MEHVIIYAFTKDGSKLLDRYQQDLEYPDNEVHMILPEDQTDGILLHAVCNYEQLWDEPIESLEDLKEYIVRIKQPDGVFNGSMIMQGDLEMTQTEVQDKKRENIIWVKRIAARIDFSLNFAPEVNTDKFYLTDIKVYSIPNCSYLVRRPQEDDMLAGDDAPFHIESTEDNFYDGMLLQTVGDDLSTPSDSVTSTFYLFENRRGKEPDNTYSTKFANNKEMWETLKAEVAENTSEGYPQATYLVISGTYITDNGNTTQSATYTIYLGKNNYSDFNVTRNCKYAVTATIKTCNDLDTRVDAVTLNKPEITGSFNNPLDAHFNVGRCFGFTANRGGWELYVENPDEHPWLEVSLSSTYRPNIPGKKYKDAEGNTLAPNMIASSRIVGEGAMSGYFYVHTDEYVPVFAIGAGSKAFYGKMDNTDIPKRIAKAAGYK